MFAYLRIFSAISLIAIIAAALGVGVYFRSVASNDFMELVQKNNMSLAQGYMNTTWKQHRTTILRLQAVPVNTWQRYVQFRQFSADSFRHFEAMPVAKLTLYTPSGVRILSTNQSEIIFGDSKGGLFGSDTGGDREKIFAQAKLGEVASRIVPDTAVKAADGSLMTGTLVQTFIPIVSDNYVSVVQGSQKKVEGIIEILYDITPQWQQLATFQMTGTGGIIGIFFFLLAALFYTSRRAEAIIARQHETNLELAATAARAEAESKEKSQFLANVSHELRTPLNAIIGFSEIMKNEVMGELGNSQYRDYIKDIHGSGVHLLSLINDILDYSKAEAGKLELEVAETDVTKLLKNCIRLVSPRAEGAGVNLVDDIAKEHVVRNVDPKKLKQVMLNLLSNAVKFTPQGGEVKVATWVNVVDDSLYVEVKDTGIGIAPKDISRAMAPFGQVDSALSRKYEGTGLGLPLTKKFVELMGGTFTIQSELNVGTTITFNLPKEPPAKALKKGSSGPSKAEG